MLKIIKQKSLSHEFPIYKGKHQINALLCINWCCPFYGFRPVSNLKIPNKNRSKLTQEGTGKFR